MVKIFTTTLVLHVKKKKKVQRVIVVVTRLSCIFPSLGNNAPFPPVGFRRSLARSAAFDRASGFIDGTTGVKL
jgi:hypothetical protein